jgi:hypothetical protein
MEFGSYFLFLQEQIKDIIIIIIITVVLNHDGKLFPSVFNITVV